MDLTSATVVLTGATSGIGLAAATRLAGTVPRLVLQGPEPEHAVADRLDALRGRRAGIAYAQADFRRLDDVRSVAARIGELAGTLDVLINNAGIPGARQRTLSSDGIEATLQVNYLALVLLTEALLPRIPRGGRIVNVSSATHQGVSLALDDLGLERTDYSDVRAYAQSKLAIVTYSRWLARDLEDRGIDVVSLSPGVISTGLLHAMFAAGGAPTERGAQNVIEAARGDLRSGDYVDDGVVVPPSADARDEQVQARLRAATTDLLGLPDAGAVT
jgi:NAD(P)-dependent dehydrogenase (short-subunit alcohol dehydrogenase family)